MKKGFYRLGCALLALLLAALPVLAGAEETGVAGTEEEALLPDAQMDQQALFAGYVRSLFYGTARQSRAADTAGSLLTGNNAILYGELKRVILEMAEGLRTSTVVEISPAIFVGESNYWTAAELGVSSIVDGGYVTDEAAQAVMDKFSTDFDLVMEALLRDCPYEMYWLDKSRSARRRTCDLNAIVDEDVRLGWTGVFTYWFPISGDYAAGDYALDPSAVQRAKIAAANARAIVNRYAAASDLDRLNAYRQEICDLASYYELEEGEAAPAFGDPWQMIWVFDGDPDTGVHCEGYAKAFQYLCEQSGFQADILCVIASGMMDGGPHMWNIMRMDDGRNYLVDVTNCDGSGIGAPDVLFMAACSGGSVENGYVYASHGYNLLYAYDAETLSVYPSGWLEMSDKKYTRPLTSLKTVTLPADTLAIQESAFEGDAMEWVILPQGALSIGSRAFADCANLRYATLPGSLEQIADDAFDGCENLTILCAPGSAAAAFAAAHGFACQEPDAAE